MSVVNKLALGVLLAGVLTCVAISAPPQNQSLAPVWYQHGPSDPYLESSQLAKQFVDSKKEDEKRDIRKKLTDVLTQQFDQQIQQQQKELEDLEKEIANLRAVLKKRVDAKSAIVERRIEQLIQDAEGLGWNAPSTSGGNRALFGSPYRSPSPTRSAAKVP
jgi:hypothetical protein